MEIKFKSSGIRWDRTKRFDLECPNGHPLHVTLGEIQHNATVRCSHGESVKLEADQFNREMAKVERSLNDLFK